MDVYRPRKVPDQEVRRGVSITASGRRRSRAGGAGSGSPPSGRHRREPAFSGEGHSEGGVELLLRRSPQRWGGSRRPERVRVASGVRVALIR